ncbi:unnamed protein product [Diatraea saccharalis]|uniref:Uncharacterized protein n=1 Tax=Diatraea saccharalis TaxID=40085 RepID=A0A9N9R2J1_9NEOP|nr:unnamed protein product [Diatraea saccharalis]
MECTQKYGLTPADVLQLREKKMPDNDNVKCMFACAYKASGMMDDKGMLSVDGVKKISEKYLSEYPEKMDNAFKFVDACQSVNDQAVSDGDRGCERAALIFKCSLEQAAVSLTEMEIKVEFTKLVMKCMKDHPVDMKELTGLQQYIVPKNKDVKCLLACAYKLEGIMTDKGLYDKEHAYKIAELSKNGDEKRLENGKKMADICVKEVNEADVSGDDKECERAALLFKCTIENAPKKFTDMDCTENYKLTQEEMAQLLDKKIPDNDKIKCMFACAFKASGLMDDKGMLSVDGAKKVIDMVFADDPEKTNKALNFIDACKSGETYIQF